MSQTQLHTPLTRLDHAALLVLGALLVLRLLALLFDPNSLYADETQYWLWAQSLDWGYFSKPPMIAWLIAGATAVFGDADWAVRLPAPFLHTVTAVMLGLTAGRLFGAEARAWTMIGWATMPAVWLSSAIISTDAVLMVGVSTGLYALVRLREAPSWPFALLLGAAAGYAFLSKYAAIYLLLGLGLSAVVDAPARKALVSLQGLTALVVFGVIISGNVLWNAANDFATVSHTAANANWGASLFNPGELITFLTDQLGVFGPVFFPVLIAAIITAARRVRLDFGAAQPRLMLALFSAPVLVIVSAQAFISRAHANWAAVAYAAGIILTIAFLLDGPRWRRRALYGSVGLHAVLGLVLMALAASTPLSDAAGLANAFKRVREWPATVDAVEQAAERLGADAIAFDNRNDFHQMQRYGEASAPLYMWMRYAGPHNFAEAGWPLPAGLTGTILIVSERPIEVPLIAGDFDRFEPAGEIVIALGGGRERRYQLFAAEGYAPLTRDAEYEARVAAMRAAAESD